MARDADILPVISMTCRCNFRGLTELVAEVPCQYAKSALRIILTIDILKIAFCFRIWLDHNVQYCCFIGMSVEHYRQILKSLWKE